MSRLVLLIALSPEVGIFLFQDIAEVDAKRPIKTRTEILSIPASAFVPSDELVEYANNGVVKKVSAIYGAFYAPVLKET